MKACENMDPTDFFPNRLFLAYTNGSDLHCYLHIKQGSEIQTQVVA